MAPTAVKMSQFFTWKKIIFGFNLSHMTALFGTTSQIIEPFVTLNEFSLYTWAKAQLFWDTRFVLYFRIMFVPYLPIIFFFPI